MANSGGNGLSLLPRKSRRVFRVALAALGQLDGTHTPAVGAEPPTSHRGLPPSEDDAVYAGDPQKRSFVHRAADRQPRAFHPVPYSLPKMRALRLRRLRDLPLFY